MSKVSRVLVKFRNGENVTYVIPGRKEYEAFVAEAAKWFGEFMYVGSDTVLRKKEIMCVIYQEEGNADG